MIADRYVYDKMMIIGIYDNWYVCKYFVCMCKDGLNVCLCINDYFLYKYK